MMSFRPLAPLDLPYIYSFRDEAIGLDTARTLTRGNPLGAVGLFAYVNPARHIYSAIVNGEEESVLGGIIHSREVCGCAIGTKSLLSNRPTVAAARGASAEERVGLDVQ